MLVKIKGLRFFLIAFFWVAGSQSAFAFSCTFGKGLDLTVDLNRVPNIGNEIVVYNFETKTCTGLVSHNFYDSLRISHFVPYSVLNGSGLVFYYKYNHLYHDYRSAINRCVWPWGYSHCPVSGLSGQTYPVKGALVLKRISKSNSTIAANQPLAYIRFQQRGNYGNGSIWGGNYHTFLVKNSTALRLPTCGVDSASQDQTVNLPDVSKSQFTGVDSTAGSKSFAITLNCQSGVAVYASITDSNQVSNSGPNLTLDSSSTAAGVGVQLLFNGHPKSFGQSNKFHVAGNSSTPAKSHTVYFEARYAQTASNITPGTVGAKAVISFEYL